MSEDNLSKGGEGTKITLILLLLAVLPASCSNLAQLADSAKIIAAKCQLSEKDHSDA